MQPKLLLVLDSVKVLVTSAGVLAADAPLVVLVSIQRYTKVTYDIYENRL